MKDFLLRKLGNALDASLPFESRQNSQLIQRNLFFQYQEMLSRGAVLPCFRDTGFRVYSQTDEDGLLLYLFALIGFTNRVVLDIAAGLPSGGNTTNLITNWGCHALLVEGSAQLVAEAGVFYQRHADTWLSPPRLRQAWVTAENINQLITEEGFSGEIDLFSLDVDGVDYWLWESLDAVLPRVVMVEYQDLFYPDESVTVPYRPDFDRFSVHPDYFGASLSAFVKLARRKGYRLVGCNRYGFNAFFVRNDLAGSFLPEVSVQSCLTHPKVLAARDAKRAELLELPWEVV
ncbi:hypothetical protein [Citrifermentans bremense]|uniref:hypothetical protein n=1 Tax=Citrifermentans bremense TaxID=60035 RepID=UPI000424B7BB|nr:hypothetical protein [Citrifermentans bremense]